MLKIELMAWKKIPMKEKSLKCSFTTILKVDDLVGKILIA
jgi:hypothetical protein